MGHFGGIVNFARLLRHYKIMCAVGNRYLVAIVFLFFLASVSNGQVIATIDKDVFAAGVGFGGGLGAPGISYNIVPDHSANVAPAIIVSYEHIFEGTFGISGYLNYSSANLSASNLPYSVYNALGSVVQSGTLSDKANGSYINLAARGLYHFKTKDNIELYAGVVFGYSFTTYSSTVTTSQGSYPTSSFYPGIIFGAVAGLRVYVTKQVGLWAELGYSGMPNYLAGVGVAYRLGRF